jgi:hypothetical protein
MLSDGGFRLAMGRRLGLSDLPRGHPHSHLFLWRPWPDSEHAHTCTAPSAMRVLRHDNIVEVVGRTLRRGGVALFKEPLLAALDRAARVSLEAAQQAHASRMGRPTDNSGQTARPSSQARSKAAAPPSASAALRPQPELLPIAEDASARDGEEVLEDGDVVEEPAAAPAGRPDVGTFFPLGDVSPTLAPAPSIAQRQARPTPQQPNTTNRIDASTLPWVHGVLVCTSDP